MTNISNLPTTTTEPIEVVSNATLALPSTWLLFRLSELAKTPLAGSGGCRDATRDRTVFDGWRGNIGLTCGSESGLFVLDFDGPDGILQLDYLRRRCGKVPRTVAVDTPSGGIHIYFRIPIGFRVGSPVRLLPGMDVRGGGSYVVIPPSRLKDGEYKWRVSPVDTDIKDLPPAWFAYLDDCPDQRDGSNRRYRSPFTSTTNLKKERRTPAPNGSLSSPNYLCPTPIKPRKKEVFAGGGFDVVEPSETSPDWYDGLESIGIPRDRHPELIRAIWMTRPTEPHTRNRQLLVLARTLARWFDVELPAEAVRPCVDIWWYYARKVSITSKRSNWTEFDAIWARTKWRPETLERWWTNSEGEAVPRWTQQMFPNNAQMHRLVQYFKYVDRMHGDHFLGCRELARLLGCSKTAANRYLRKLEAAEVLECLERGRHSVQKATEWKYIGHRINLVQC